MQGYLRAHRAFCRGPGHSGDTDSETEDDDIDDNRPDADCHHHRAEDGFVSAMSPDPHLGLGILGRRMCGGMAAQALNRLRFLADHVLPVYLRQLQPGQSPQLPPLNPAVVQGFFLEDSGIVQQYHQRRGQLQTMLNRQTQQKQQQQTNLSAASAKGAASTTSSRKRKQPESLSSPSAGVGSPVGSASAAPPEPSSGEQQLVLGTSFGHLVEAYRRRTSGGSHAAWAASGESLVASRPLRLLCPADRSLLADRAALVMAVAGLFRSRSPVVAHGKLVCVCAVDVLCLPCPRGLVVFPLFLFF